MSPYDALSTNKGIVIFFLLKKRGQDTLGPNKTNQTCQPPNLILVHRLRLACALSCLAILVR